MKTLQLTLGLLKPSTVARPLVVQDIYKHILDEGMLIVRKKEMKLPRSQAEEFYKEHQGKFFHHRLVTYMSSGPIVALALCGDNAIQRWRSLMGHTKVYKTQYASPNTIRGSHGISDTRNATHGSDSEESAKVELAFFFPEFNVDTWYRDEEPIFREGKYFFDEKEGIHKVKKEQT